jgi:hypothetical protein
MAMVGSSCGFELLDKGRGSRGHTIHQAPPDSLASVSLAPALHAEIVYTPANQSIGKSNALSFLPIDLNNDGIVDLSISAEGSYCCRMCHYSAETIQVAVELLWEEVGWAVEDSAMSTILDSPPTSKTYKIPASDRFSY